VRRQGLYSAVEDFRGELTSGRARIVVDLGLCLSRTQLSLNGSEFGGERLEFGAGGAESSGHRAEILA